MGKIARKKGREGYKRMKSIINMLKMAIILDSNRGPQNALFLLSTGTIIATNTVLSLRMLVTVMTT